MKACQNCGAQMPDDLLFCTHCGSPLQEANYPGQQYQQQYPKPGGVFESNNLAVAALAFGLVGLLLTLAAPFLPGISSVVGIVLCIVGIVLRNGDGRSGVLHYRHRDRRHRDLYRVRLHMRPLYGRRRRSGLHGLFGLSSRIAGNFRCYCDEIKKSGGIIL